MMTIITRVMLKEGAEPTWDDAMRERMRAARDQLGWIGGQITIPLDGPSEEWWHEVIEDVRRPVTPLGAGEIAA